MVSVKAEKPPKRASLKNSKSLAPEAAKTKPEKKKKKTRNGNKETKTDENSNNYLVQPASASEQLGFFLNEFQSANDIHLSSLELESIKESCFLELSKSLDQDVKTLEKHMKESFGPSWKEALCEKHLVEGKIDPGCPAVLIISSSALRSIELLRGFRSLTKECRAVKLFSKHMKVEEQVSSLKNRVNIGSGTPSRIKKLIDIEALGISRIAVIVLDMHADVKGYSLFTLPQVRDEFWDLYKTYFHQRLLQGDLQLCLYGPIPDGNVLKGKRRKNVDE
ncbi:hypothetical protein ACOSP7_007025 [Xanthoceras sorbifolium]|uniref:Protein CMSS1 n=1 Tax=Xanthoceras sorbifolium TaxID=99658 RepID=A0ABQ8I9Q9_9ROSI|nr:hypothetical protein JRO89_XS03G0133900 [Xanthoceras sorbifolium]